MRLQRESLTAKDTARGGGAKDTTTIIKNINNMGKTKTTVENVEVTKPQLEQYLIFTVVKIGGNWKIAVGNNIMSQMTFSNKKEAIEYIDSKPWDLIINTTCYLYEISQKNK